MTKDVTTAVCRRCKRRWNISRLRKVPLSGYICPECADAERRQQQALERRTAKKIAVACAMAFVAVLLTMWARAQAVAWRGNTAWGGEALVPVYVIAAWPVWRTLRDWARSCREDLHI
ncbi:MAG: hypothetical protein E7423_01855 [Ruminococcaceae bacterium]|nr:hypothetical protein [Oscillospiraceae bacterium]